MGSIVTWGECQLPLKLKLSVNHDIDSVLSLILQVLIEVSVAHHVPHFCREVIYHKWLAICNTLLAKHYITSSPNPIINLFGIGTVSSCWKVVSLTNTE